MKSVISEEMIKDSDDKGNFYQYKHDGSKYYYKTTRGEGIAFRKAVRELNNHLEEMFNSEEEAPQKEN